MVRVADAWLRNGGVGDAWEGKTKYASRGPELLPEGLKKEWEKEKAQYGLEVLGSGQVVQQEGSAAKGEVEEAMLSLRVATNSTTQLAPVALLK